MKFCVAITVFIAQALAYGVEATDSTVSANNRSSVDASATIEHTTSLKKRAVSDDETKKSGAASSETSLVDETAKSAKPQAAIHKESGAQDKIAKDSQDLLEAQTSEVFSYVQPFEHESDRVLKSAGADNHDHVTAAANIEESSVTDVGLKKGESDNVELEQKSGDEAEKVEKEADKDDRLAAANVEEPDHGLRSAQPDNGEFEAKSPDEENAREGLSPLKKVPDFGLKSAEAEHEQERTAGNAEEAAVRSFEKESDRGLKNAESNSGIGLTQRLSPRTMIDTKARTGEYETVPINNQIGNRHGDDSNSLEGRSGVTRTAIIKPAVTVYRTLPTPLVTRSAPAVQQLLPLQPRPFQPFIPFPTPVFNRYQPPPINPLQPNLLNTFEYMRRSFEPNNHQRTNEPFQLRNYNERLHYQNRYGQKQIRNTYPYEGDVSTSQRISPNSYNSPLLNAVNRFSTLPQVNNAFKPSANNFDGNQLQVAPSYLGLKYKP